MAGSNFDREELGAPLAEINMTPLVDVMLVLLVIFLVTAPMLNNSIKLNLPQEAASQITEQKPVVISIDKTGNYFLDDQVITSDQLQNELQKLVKTNPKQQVHIRADISVNYGKVSHVLATAQRLGISNVGFVTEPK